MTGEEPSSLGSFFWDAVSGDPGPHRSRDAQDPPDPLLLPNFLVTNQESGLGPSGRGKALYGVGVQVSDSFVSNAQLETGNLGPSPPCNPPRPPASDHRAGGLLVSRFRTPLRGNAWGTECPKRIFR